MGLRQSPAWERMPGAIRLVGCLIVCLYLGSAGVLAAPYLSYTYDFWGQSVPAPQAYLPTEVVDGFSLGIGSLKTPQDIFVTDDHYIFLLDTGNNRIIMLTESWQVDGIIDGFQNNGASDGFKNPSGIYVSSDGLIYVADTDNARIVVLNREGQLIRILGAPEPDADGIIPQDFRYRPKKVGVDPAGRVYVVAEDIYDGILEFGGDGTFRGFIGAPRVVLKLGQYLWRKIATREQKARMQLFLPTEYSNLDMDERGFIFTTVASGSLQKEDAIRRLNPSGTDVLRRRGFYPPMGDYGSVFLDDQGALAFPRSAFVDIVARKCGIYSALDRTRGRVFTYDAEGNLLYVFGGIGNQIGTFQVPSALDVLGDKVLVVDHRRNEVTVFEPTAYAQMIHSAIESHYTGEYDRANELWKSILAQNANYDLAYTGIGHALLRQDRFQEAMAYFRAGQNRRDYSEAFQLYRRQVVIEYFPWLMSGLLLTWLVSMLNRRLGWTKRLSLGLSNYKAMAATGEQDGIPTSAFHSTSWSLFRLGDSLGYARYVMRHPFDGFWDLKHEKKGTMGAAGTLLTLLSLTYVLMRQYTGFIFNTKRLVDLNILLEVGSVIIPFMLWSVVSWSLTTLMEGKGTFRDIVIATAYALTPLIIINLPLTLLSNGITAEEGAFYYLFMAIALIWAGGLLIIGTMVTHEYTMFKTLLTAFLTLVGIGVVLFIGLLFVGVFGQVVGWLKDIYLEIAFRL